MKIEDLNLFVDVARHGSFAAVARDRGTDASNISRAISNLEDSLGTRLFQRTTRAMVLTEAGNLYLQRLPSIIEDMERLRDEAASVDADPVGTLRLTASVAFGQVCIVPMLSKFADAFPRLKLDLVLSDNNLDLISERIDLAIRLGESYRADVIGAKLFPTRYHAVASPTYIEKFGRPVAPQELSQRSCLLFSLPDFRTKWLFKSSDGVLEVPVKGQFILSNVMALRSAALAGLGPTLLVDWMIGDVLKSGDLVDLFPAHQVTATAFDTAAWLLYPSREYLPQKTRSVITFLRENLSQRN